MPGPYNRIKFLVAGPVLERANRRIPGAPHALVADALGEGIGSVLDLCGGNGYLARLVVERHAGAHVTVVDLSPEMLADGRRRAKGRPGGDRIAFERGDVTALPFGDASAGAVVASFGLHELDGDAQRAAIREVARVLAPGGRLVLLDLDAPVGAAPLYRAYLRLVEPADASGVFAGPAAQLVAAAGLDVVRRERRVASPLLTFHLLVADKPAP